MISRIFPVVFLVLGCFIFLTGMHNIDNAYNLQAGMLDKSIMISFAKGELYELGIFMAMSGFLISVVSALIIGDSKCQYSQRRKK